MKTSTKYSLAYVITTMIGFFSFIMGFYVNITEFQKYDESFWVLALGAGLMVGGWGLYVLGQYFATKADEAL